MEITVIFLLILIKFYWRSTENIEAEYMCLSVCLLKNTAKFKDAISLMVLKDAANGFNKMLSLLCSSLQREVELLLEAQLKNPKKPIRGEKIGNSKVPEREL